MRLLIGARQVVTCRGPARARHGTEMAELDVVDHGVVAIDPSGRFAAVGSESMLRGMYDRYTVEEVSGVLFPGFVDSHTHAAFGAPRLEDHERRAMGVGYKEIAAAGGGILSSVRDVRSRTADDLTDLLVSRLQLLLSLGTTTVEVKSGYGLDVESELKQLDVIQRCLTAGPHVVPTFLGAHEVPAEYRAARDEYLELVIREMLPRVATDQLARFCDIFCEPGVFSSEESRRVLVAAKQLGLEIKIHADELDSGAAGAELAVDLSAVSADHLAAISQNGIDALARSPTVATLLPGTMMFLGRSAMAPARKLIDGGAAVALATDFNPGSSPGMSLPLMAMMGVSQLRMRPTESILAITANGAAAVGEAGRCGQIEVGFRADMVGVDASDWREVPYWFGVNLVRRVWVGGQLVTNP